MPTPQEVHAKLAHAKELEKQATEDLIRLKKDEAAKAQQELQKQQSELAKLRANAPS